MFLIPCTSPLDITSRILTLIFLYDIYNIIRISKLHISVDLLVYRENNKYLVSVFFPGKCQSHGWMLLELGHCDPYIYTSMVKGWMLLELDHCDPYLYDIREVCWCRNINIFILPYKLSTTIDNQDLRWISPVHFLVLMKEAYLELINFIYHEMY